MTLASTEGVSLGVKAAEKRHRKKLTTVSPSTSKVVFSFYHSLFDLGS